MKKIISVLLILVCSFVVFAGGNLGVTVESKVGAKLPSFVLKAGLSKNNYGTTGYSDKLGSFDNAVIEDGVPPITDADVVVYFQIVQEGSEGVDDLNETFARYNNSVNFNISITDMLTTREDKSQYSIPGMISGGEKLLALNDNKIITERKNDSSYVAIYNGKVLDGQPIASFVATWPRDVLAPNGTYMASVKLEYAIN